MSTELEKLIGQSQVALETHLAVTYAPNYPAYIRAAQSEYGLLGQLSAQNARASLTEDMYELLRKGETRTHELQNALAGHARNVGVLTAKGLMEFVTWKDGVASYKITEAGRKALLAHLGVMEIERPA